MPPRLSALPALSASCVPPVTFVIVRLRAFRAAMISSPVGPACVVRQPDTWSRQSLPWPEPVRCARFLSINPMSSRCQSRAERLPHLVVIVHERDDSGPVSFHILSSRESAASYTVPCNQAGRYRRNYDQFMELTCHCGGLRLCDKRGLAVVIRAGMPKGQACRHDLRG